MISFLPYMHFPFIIFYNSPNSEHNCVTQILSVKVGPWTCEYICVWECACVAAELRECDGDQYGGVYFCHATVCLCVCESVSVCGSVHTRVSEFVCAGYPGYSGINTTNDYHFHKPPFTTSLRPLLSLHTPTSPPHAHTHKNQNKPPPSPTHTLLHKPIKNDELQVWE